MHSKKTACFVTAMAALISFTSSALAQDAEEEDDDKGLHWSISTDPDDYIPPWHAQKFFEIGVRLDYGFALLKPSAMSGGQQMSFLFTADYGWSYADGDGYMGPLFQIGGLTISGHDDSIGEDVSAGSVLIVPGFFNGNYVGDKWVFGESLSVPFTNRGPGFRLDLSFTYIFNNRLNLEFGAHGSLLQSPLQINGEDANIMSVGAYANLILMLWGEIEYVVEQ